MEIYSLQVLAAFVILWLQRTSQPRINGGIFSRKEIPIGQRAFVVFRWLGSVRNTFTSRHQRMEDGKQFTDHL
jgi:hypothetical protein